MSSAPEPPGPTRDAPIHLALVGLMGSGKSSVGRVLADQLDRVLIDTDELVERVTGESISELFRSRGEAAFRRYELDSLGRALARSTPSVIATGGGVVTTPKARRMLARDATVVWLRARPESLLERLRGDATRPLLGDRDPLTVLRELHEHRSPLYAEVADLVVDVDGHRPEQVAAEVLDALGLPA
jgi:shikimate kinase